MNKQVENKDTKDLKQSKTPEIYPYKEFWNMHLLTWENNFYSKNSVFRKQNEKCIELAKKLPTSSKIMEIGCGTGFFAESLLEEKNFEYLALDFSTSAIDGTQIRTTNATFRKVPIESIRKYLVKYPFDFNAVISIELLNWLSQEDLKTVAKLSSGKKYIHTFLSHPNLIQKMTRFLKGLIIYGNDYQLANEYYYKDDDILKYFPDGKIISDPELGFNRIITNF